MVTRFSDRDAALARVLAGERAAVPCQNNFDYNMGPDNDGFRYTLNVQPVIPISLNTDWNLINRTILPIVYQNDILPDSGDQFGLGDTVQSLFFSPAKPLPAGGFGGGARCDGRDWS